MATHLSDILQVPENEWVTFPGGELEGKRPRRLCPVCRDRLQRTVAEPMSVAPRRPLCFQCYRVELDREKALKAAGELDTATTARFQVTLPFEPVNQPRLTVLKAAREAERAVATEGTGRFVDRRRQAQIAARHALQIIADGLKHRQIETAARERVFSAALHAAELQLPESWLPFVVAR
jgi:hypothetical protein